MPQFPKREADIMALAQQAIMGYSLNPQDFPHADLPGLQVKVTLANEGIFAHTQKEAETKQALDVRNDGVHDLAVFLEEQFSISEGDTHNDQGKLEKLGWGARAKPAPVPPPGEPRNLEAAVQGPGDVKLDWKGPAGPSRTHIRIYRLQRHQQPAGGGAFSDWQDIGVAVHTEIHLTNQPRMVQLEYRVVAVTTGGETPSRAVDVVL